MAQRRMFSKKITDTDMFLDMPLSAQALYFHLNMHADDDGFIANTKTIRRMIGASDDDLKLLFTKQFVFAFESGVVVIKDWKIHNYIRKDTYNTTIYGDEKKQLDEDVNGSYTFRRRDVDDSSPQVRLGKDRLGKVSKTYSPAKAEPPLPYKEIVDYLNQKAGTSYRASGKKTQSLIKARYNESFKLDDFKKVIDNKVAEWKSDSNMAKYLRPETLFGTKFESYLNQSKASSPQNYGGGQVADNLPW
jgi:uncharacterized phage protein (TIGR02220 family)